MIRVRLDGTYDTASFGGVSAELRWNHVQAKLRTARCLAYRRRGCVGRNAAPIAGTYRFDILPWTDRLGFRSQSCTYIPCGSTVQSFRTGHPLRSAVLLPLCALPRRVSGASEYLTLRDSVPKLDVHDYAIPPGRARVSRNIVPVRLSPTDAQAASAPLRFGESAHDHSFGVIDGCSSTALARRFGPRLLTSE